MFMSLLLMSFLVVENDFSTAEEAWRAERLEKLKSEDGWLNLIGLFWLKEGENLFGTAEVSDILLPTMSTVPHAGTIIVNDDKVRFTMERAQRALLNGEAKREGELKMSSPPDILAHNHIRMFLIERDDRLALRVRDLRAKAVVNFKGIQSFKAKEKYVVEAQYTPFEENEVIWVSTVIGTQEMMEVPGKLSFEWEEESYELLPFVEGEGDDRYLFIIFKDLTSGSETYPGGRYLKASIPAEGEAVMLNFNRAYNPPCAFTPYATCPLPPADNWLDVSIEAGEKYIAGDH